ncbi:hypothetical protein [Nonomuraea longicatena]|uniref:Thioredoxin domain-containing protein n=1 Tax=Nonomuraea longicatena TaxID=83682 RepID=A0ABP4A137_9ACTN
MSYLVAAVVLVGLLCALNLLLTFGVIRRLRAQAANAASAARPPAPTVGSTVQPFTATAVTGEEVSAITLGRAVVAFFDVGCGPCRERLPAFVAAAPRQSRPVLAVVVGGDTEHPMVTSLLPFASVVVEGHDGVVAKAFGISSFPTLCAIDEFGVITDTALDLGALA